ncbi:hypothetical protein AVEN_86098-1 [Araneus ventricosus]|uniref:DUF5641 domain-containing protein n=1 Tax=Araneus ventricosus TaxID=182803 RepID=A0A4Y2WRF5_ARAVE|nr:hypothetical protein AVEN_86098-1 [Araneus ventricosus]
MKRHLLSTIGKIFDPLGLLSPFTIRVKCILQVLWMKEISWDEELPPDIQKTWCQWVSEVPRLSELHFPRYVLSSSTGEPTDVLELHCFCDASQKAYGVVIYTRVVKDCNVEVNLLVSKSRVAPLTKITMPRLELLGALLAARLARKVKAVVDLKRPSKVFFWTDSKIKLHWIKGSSKRWKSFVSNRVIEIQSRCDTSAWALCPGKQNPADFLSRGVSVEILLNSDLWWKGPQFLREVDFPTDTGNDDTSISLHDISDELKKTSDYSPLTFTVLNHNSFIDDILKISNNYMSIIRVMCYVLRFIHNVKNIERLAGHLTIKELQRAEIYLIQLVQQDESGILRVGGRLKYSDLSLEKKHPIVLPDKHPLTLIIVSENIEWKFIPPKSPNFGGPWEAGVKSFKHHLKRVVGNAHLTLEKFLTIILEIESVRNSRPLTPLSTEFDNFETLSPGHFLIGRPLTSIVEPDLLNIK